MHLFGECLGRGLVETMLLDVRKGPIGDEVFHRSPLPQQFPDLGWAQIIFNWLLDDVNVVLRKKERRMVVVEACVGQSQWRWLDSPHTPSILQIAQWPQSGQYQSARLWAAQNCWRSFESEGGKKKKFNHKRNTKSRKRKRWQTSFGSQRPGVRNEPTRSPPLTSMTWILRPLV